VVSWGHPMIHALIYTAQPQVLMSGNIQTALRLQCRHERHSSFAEAGQKQLGIAHLPAAGYLSFALS
jgi:hypothetical protein